MPVYEYACEKCGHEFEAEQRITEDPLKTCPRCRARKLKRLISQTSFVLQGGGWYADLYSSKGKSDKSDRPEAKGEGSAKAEGSAATDAKSGDGGGSASGDGGSPPSDPKPKKKREG